MKIQDLEKELNITRSNIRFYEKEGLLAPPRKENGYREYGNDEIAKLKKIIIFRKLGISVADIKSIFDGTLSLQDAINNNIDRLHKEIDNLNGAVKVCEEIKRNNSNEDDFPQDYFWSVINNRENAGEKFNEILKDYIKEEIENFPDYVASCFLIGEEFIKEKLNLPASIIVFLIISIACGFAAYFFSDDSGISSFLIGFLFPLVTYIISSIVTFPLYVLMKYLRKNHPKIAKISKIVLTIVVTLIIFRVLYMVIEPLIKLFQFFFELSS